MRNIVDKELYMRKKEEILEFIFENRHRYGVDKAAALALSFQFDMLLDEHSTFSCPEMEILSKFGVIKKNLDPYQKFKDFLIERDFLRGNVVEVGAGLYPRLCEIIMEDKPRELVKITAYDPELIFDTISGVNFVKESFTNDTNIDDADTLYGLISM